MKKTLQIKIRFTISKRQSAKEKKKIIVHKQDHLIQKRSIKCTEKTLRTIQINPKQREDTKHQSKQKAINCEIIRIQVKPLLDTNLIEILKDTWKNKRPDARILKDVDVRFLPLAEPQIWLTENGQRVIKSCDIHKETFTRHLTFCFHQEEIDNVCRTFARELLQWLARLKNFPLSVRNHTDKARHATSKEILYRKHTISITKPLINLGISPTLQNVIRIKIMLNKLWCVRFIHLDDRRPVKQKINSICVKKQTTTLPSETGSKNINS